MSFSVWLVILFLLAVSQVASGNIQPHSVGRHEKLLSLGSVFDISSINNVSCPKAPKPDCLIYPQIIVDLEIDPYFSVTNDFLCSKAIKSSKYTDSEINCSIIFDHHAKTSRKVLGQGKRHVQIALTFLIPCNSTIESAIVSLRKMYTPQFWN